MNANYKRDLEKVERPWKGGIRPIIMGYNVKDVAHVGLQLVLLLLDLMKTQWYQYLASNFQLTTQLKTGNMIVEGHDSCIK